MVAPATVPCGEGEAELGGVIPPDPDRGRERRWGEEGIGFRGWGSPCGGWMDKGGPAGPWGGWAGLLGRSPVGGGGSLLFLPLFFCFLFCSFSFYLFSFTVLIQLMAYKYFINLCFLYYNYLCNIWH